MHSSIVTSDLTLVGAEALIFVAAASAAYLTHRRAERGRIRGSIAYLAGYLAGALATIGLAQLLAPFVTGGTSIAHVGMIASFIGPFAGILHSELRFVGREQQPPSLAEETVRPAENFRPLRQFLEALPAREARSPTSS